MNAVLTFCVLTEISDSILEFKLLIDSFTILINSLLDGCDV